MRTIALETSAQPGELALRDADTTLLTTALPADQRTTESFAVEMKQAMQSVGWQPQDIQLFAVSEGPGSFTGLRIGVTAAKTFAYATGCHVVAINTLRLLAWQAEQDEPVWSVLDAQRQQLFVAEFQRHGNRLSELTPTQIVPALEWLTQLPPRTRLTGSGLAKWKNKIPDHLGLTPAAHWNPSAKQLAVMAQRQFADQGAADIWKLTPQYYRRSAAEEKLG